MQQDSFICYYLTVLYIFDLNTDESKIVVYYYSENMFKVKINVRNVIPMPELVKLTFCLSK